MNLKKIANVILIGILAFSSFQIASKLIDYKKSEKLYSEIQDIVTSTEVNDVEESEDNISTYEKLKAINPDYKFWVEVENTNINYPVVQGTDNSFYLKKDFNKKDSSAGTIFMDALNNFEVDNNTVLYGHNMNNKTMFNNVTLFKKQDFFNQNNKIKIKHNEEEKEYIYEVFSVYHSDNTFDYNTVRFGEGYSFENFIEDIKEKSMYKTNIEVTESDKIITLSTCSYEFKGAKTTVHAKLIETRYLNPEKQKEEELRKEEEQKRLEEEQRIKDIENDISQMIDFIQ